MAQSTYIVSEATPKVLVSALKAWHPELSWSKVRKLLTSRRVVIAGTLCLDESRRLKVGDAVDVYRESRPAVPKADKVRVVFLDRHLVVVEKPPRMLTLRHHKEKSWQRSRKAKQPTLEEVIPDLIYSEQREERPELFSVHRIDRDTSGLLVFARSEGAQKGLIEQFAAHDVKRRYLAVVHGTPEEQTLRSYLVRDRGDGLRGSTETDGEGKLAVTHVQPMKTIAAADGQSYSEIECQLETGRTHQIRIHLAEQGNPVCGDTRYRGPHGASPIADSSRAPRLALHAGELGFRHPATGEELEFQSPWPHDLRQFLKKLTPTVERGDDG